MPSAPANRSHAGVTFRVGTFYDGTLAKARRNVDVTIADGRVLSVAEGAEGGEHLRRIPCMTPGLTNAHVHLEGSGEAASQDAWSRSTPNERVIAAVANARTSLYAGVTSIRDLGCSGGTAMSVAAAIAEGRLEGPRIASAGAVICMTGGHGWFLGRQVDSPWEARKAVREQLLAGATCIKFIATGGVLTRGAVPGNAQLTPEELAAGVDEAHRHGMRCAAHAIGTIGIKNALRAGIDSIEHAHMLDDEAIELFKANGAYLVPTLTAPTCILEHADDGKQPEWALRKARTVAEEMQRNIARAYRAGVKIAGGSDAGTPYNFHERYAYEIELMHRLLGMSPQEALHAATAVASELVGLTSGTLAPGEPADLLFLESDIADDLSTLYQPLAVMKDGALLFDRAR